jgi:DNA helicase-2/ATP-dependent DNA helicase PcrA
MGRETSLVLTSEQRAIIDHPLEPVRVSAGAGTGKTTTIVLRLAALIEQGIEPEAALGITFTNKAAEELADRLRQELPDLAAEGRDVEVTTYHGFAYGLLQEFGALVGMERGAEVIGPGFQRQLIEEGLIDGTYRALDLTWPSGRVAEAATLTRQLGDNLLTTADLATAAPGSPDEVWERRLELASVADAYAEAKHRVGVVDYADLVRLAHRLVTEHPELAEQIRGRYRVVLLDEYQDTDPAQRLLITAIFGDGFPLTAVGDADQTIYEWRGASLQNFEGFPAHFPTSDGAAAATLPLTENRRSDRIILDLANRIRTEIHGPAGFDPLVPVADADLGMIEVAWLRTEADEADWIANRVLRAREDGIPWSEIAALFRKNKHIGPVRDALLDAGVPVQVVSLGGLLDVPEVAELHAWLRILHDPEDSAALARILIGSSFRLGLGDLAPLARWTKAKRRRNDRDDGLRLALIEAIDRLDEVTGITAATSERLRRFHAVYSDLLVTAQGVSLVELSRQVLSAIEAWTEIDAMEDHAALSARLNLYRFLDLTESWSPLEGRPSLGAFLGYLELLRDEATVDELDTAGISTEEAVSLLTVHRAKGLEWDVVVLPAVTRGTFPSRSLGYDNPLDDPKYLPYELRIDADTLPDLSGTEGRKDRNEILSEYHQAGEWRVAYVAVTRARHTLIATGSFWSDGKNPRKPSELWTMAWELADTETVIDDPGEAPEPAGETRRTPGPDPLFGEGGWPAALRAATDDPGWLETHGDLAASAAEAAAQLRLELGALPRPPEPLPDPAPATSVTGLVTLARCPRRFKWAVIDRLPIRPSSARRRGIEFHRNVELHNLGKVPLTDLDVDLYDLTAEPAGTAPAGDPFALFLGSRLAGVKPRFAEVPVDLRIGEVRVRGRIDAVYEPEPGVWEIVDYKSGRLSDDEALDVQLHAYALAAADGAIAPDIPERLTVTFAFFGGDEYAERSYEVDEDWLAAARDRIDGLVDLIVTEDYEPTPSEECHRCDFLAFCTAGQAFVEA